MALKGDDIALSTSRAIVWTATEAASATNPQTIKIQNNSAIGVTVGGDDVAASSNGILLTASTNSIVEIALTQPDESVYAIAASGTPSVQFLVDNV
tara:strand:- start:229 stop:516 length:288 start_codon:yes stop_codon:yes gene_type:complete